MRFTDREIDRMIEFIQWGIDKGVKDIDLNSALYKLVDMKKRSGHRIQFEQRKKNGVSTQEHKQEYFGYLDCVSQEAKEFVINRVHNGNKNVYHSIMSVLNNRIKHKTVELLEEEYAFYLKKAKKHDFTESELPYVREIFEYCYAKEQERKM